MSESSEWTSGEACGMCSDRRNCEMAGDSNTYALTHPRYATFSALPLLALLLYIASKAFTTCSPICASTPT